MIAILAILLVTLIINAIYTWGIVFDHDGGFERSGTYIFEDIFTEKQKGRIRLGENLNNPIFCIPFVIWVYGIESPPYFILLEINDETESFDKIYMELISIEYVDGQKIEHNIDWEGAFTSFSILRSMDSQNVSIPAVRFEGKLPVTVDIRQSCRIQFVGYFVNKEGDKIPFDTVEYFEYETYKWRIYAGGSF